MGLLEKASAFARAKSLLHRSIELLSEEPAAAATAGATAAASDAAAAAASAEPSVFDVPVFRVRVENPEPEQPPGSPPQRTGPPAAAQPVADPTAFTDELVGVVSALEPTIDLPSRLFAILKDRLGIGKGAILLHDTARQVYAPWAAAGYDAATLRRLRIPAEDAVIGRLTGGSPLEVSDPAGLADLRRYFSSRESGGIERLVLAPLAASERLLGVVLASEVSPPFPPGAPLAACLARVAAAVVPSLQRLRDEVLRRGSVGPASPRDARKDLTRFLAAHPRGTSPFTVFTLSLERCRRRVMAANPWFDPFRLEEDLCAVVAAFTADLGRAVHLGRLRFLVAVRDLGPADTDLYAHQLASLLGSLFHATGFDAADVEVGAARTFPDGAEATPETAAELLAALAAS